MKKDFQDLSKQIDESIQAMFGEVCLLMVGVYALEKIAKTDDEKAETRVLKRQFVNNINKLKVRAESMFKPVPQEPQAPQPSGMH